MLCACRLTRPIPPLESIGCSAIAMLRSLWSTPRRSRLQPPCRASMSIARWPMMAHVRCPGRRATRPFSHSTHLVPPVSPRPRSGATRRSSTCCAPGRSTPAWGPAMSWSASQVRRLTCRCSKRSCPCSPAPGRSLWMSRRRATAAGSALRSTGTRALSCWPPRPRFARSSRAAGVHALTSRLSVAAKRWTAHLSTRCSNVGAPSGMDTGLQRPRLVRRWRVSARSNRSPLAARPTTRRSGCSMKRANRSALAASVSSGSAALASGWAT